MTPVKGYIANTDYDWFTFLRERSPLEEVNFWQPGGNRHFRTVGCTRFRTACC